MHFSPCFFYLGIHGGQRQGKITNVGGFCVQLSKLFFCMALGKLLNFSEVFSLRSDEIFLIYNMRITTIFHALILCQMLKILSILYSLIHSLKSIKVLFVVFQISKFLKMELEFDRVHLPVFIDFGSCELLKE